MSFLLRLPLTCRCSKITVFTYYLFTNLLTKASLDKMAALGIEVMEVYLYS